MRSYRLTIKSRLVATGTGIFLILVAIGIIANFYVGDAFRYNALLLSMKQVKYNVLLLRKVEKDFIYTDSRNILFHQSGACESSRVFNSTWESTINELENLKDNKIIRRNGQIPKIEYIISYYQDYNKVFTKLTDAVHEKGFKDFGLEGIMRDKIHMVEQTIKNYPGNEKLQAKMLMLRRHEKDFLLRKDLKYREEFKKASDEFVVQLNNIGGEMGKLAELVQNYQEVFLKLVEQELFIGFDENSGLQREIVEINQQIDIYLNGMTNLVEESARVEIRKAIVTLVLVSFILVSVILILLYTVSRRILSSLKNLKNYITLLGKGELPDEIVLMRNDEITDMSRSVNILTKNLKNTRQFAIEVGEGHLETQINVFENQGDLGGSLVEMRNRLLKLAEERKKVEEDAVKRNWMNEGLARFNDLLRQHRNDMRELSYTFLSQLTDFIGAVQGAIFLVNNDNPDEPFLEGLAAVAYERRKLFDKKIELGDGLVGRCAYERMMIHVNELPEDYVKITSGLGDATPRNVLLIPLLQNDELQGVLELASFSVFENYQIEFATKIGETVASTFSTLKINARTSMLLEQANIQSRELSTREEELRQNMEELKTTQEEASRREMELHQKMKLYEESISFFILDSKGIIENVSPAFCHLLGLEANLLVNRHWEIIAGASYKNKRIDDLLHKTLDLELLPGSLNILCKLRFSAIEDFGSHQQFICHVFPLK